MRQRCAVCFDSGGALPPELLGCLPDARRNRLELLHPRRARQSALAEALLRMLLAEETGLSPRSFVINRRRGEKPRCSDFEFSLSHTDGAAAAAISSQPVGVDIEHIRPPRLRLANRLLSPGELEYMRGDPALRFWELWTRHEALLKRGGGGDARFFVLGGHVLSLCGSGAEPETLDLSELLFRLRRL